MSKDFEKEYRELVSLEIPDLWDRIDAALVEKEKKDDTGNVISFDKAVGTDNEGAKQVSLNKKRKKIWPYVIPAVSVAALLLVAIPAVLLLAGGNTKSTTNESTATMAFDTVTRDEMYEGEESQMTDDNFSSAYAIEKSADHELAVECLESEPNEYDENNRFTVLFEEIIEEDGNTYAVISFDSSDEAGEGQNILSTWQNDFLIDPEGLVPQNPGVYSGLFKMLDDNTIELYVEDIK